MYGETSGVAALPPPEEAGGLVGRLVDFMAALRRAGLPVSLAESLDAVRVLGTVPLQSRESLRAGLAASTVKRPAYRHTFDTLFDLWFPPVLGESVATSVLADPDSEPERAQGDRDARSGDVARDALRDALHRLLLDGDERRLAQLAREAVSLLGRAETQPGRTSFFTYKVLRALSPDTLMAALLAAMLEGQERGGLAERVARQTLTERIRRFTEMVEADVRRRLAEDKGAEQVAKTAVRPLPDDMDFLRLSRDDLAELRRTVLPLARRLATRLTARRRLGDRGRLDFRRTVRASLGTGGVPLVTHHKPHKPHKPELAVLCDVSGSVSSFASFTLILAYALREQFSKVRAFAFVDTTDEVTRFFTPGGDPAGFMTRILAEADLVWYDGHSDYGHAIERFAEVYPDAVTPRTSLLILGDARNNYRQTGVHALHDLVQRARHAYWLNPEPRAYWGSGDSAASAYATVVDEMVEVRNAAQLQEFVGRLLPT